MPVYTCGSFGIRLNGCGGTWRAVQKNEKGFLLWESETYGTKAMKILTDKEGLVLYKQADTFKDFGVITQIAKYERVRDSVCRDLLMKEFAKENGKTQQHNEEESEAKKNQNAGDKGNTSQSMQTALKDNNTSNIATSPKKEPKRPEKRRPSGKNPNNRESVMSKLREYQKYLDDKKPKAQ